MTTYRTINNGKSAKNSGTVLVKLLYDKSMK